MNKVLVIMGSPRKGETLKAVRTFEERLKSQGEVEVEYLWLKDVNLGLCRGCFACLSRGEEFCPVRGDDRDKILARMEAADGVVFATPNYALQVTALMKNFFDRFAFIFHRPRFFGKSATSIVTQGVYGGGRIVKYIAETAEFWGFSVSKGAVVTTPPGERLPEEQAKIDRALEKAADTFYRLLLNPLAKAPSYKRVFLFHMTRTAHRVMSDCTLRDYNYFKERGWLEADYFCKAPLSPPKRLAGALAEKMAVRFMTEAKRKQEAYLKKRKIKEGGS